VTRTKQTTEQHEHVMKYEWNKEGLKEMAFFYIGMSELWQYAFHVWSTKHEYAISSKEF